jgi:hypothetical protein
MHPNWHLGGTVGGTLAARIIENAEPRAAVRMPHSLACPIPSDAVLLSHPEGVVDLIQKAARSI